MDLYNVRKIWNPDWFQGNNRRKNYFEGWYFKMVNPEKNEVFAIIPGISIGKDKNSSYSFIQVINGITGNSEFIKFGMEEFSFSRTNFNISIGDNHFSPAGIDLNLLRAGTEITGSLSFQDPIPYPVKPFSPGVMGWYRFVPTMECYHGIVSMLHSLHGTLGIAGKSIGFTGGKGYIEKDWGKSMPLAWIWMQSNHFEKEDLSVSFSIANIPWKGSAFTGFLMILSTKDKFYRFTTYTGARIREISLEKERIQLEVYTKKYLLTILAEASVWGDLQAPVEGEMIRTIRESIGAKISIRLQDMSGKIIHEGTGHPAGLEVAGDIAVLQRDLGKK